MITWATPPEPPNWMAYINPERAAELQQAGLLAENADLLSALERMSEMKILPVALQSTLEVLKTKLVHCIGGEPENFQAY